MTRALLNIHALSLSFKTPEGGEKEVLRDISFALHRGQTLALVGESGSGKSVTALSVMGLLPSELSIINPMSAIEWQGTNILHASREERRKLRGRAMAMIFQDPMSSLNPVMSVGQQLIEGIELHLGLKRRDARERAIQLLEEVGIPDPQRRLSAYPHELSGGQQQRVMIAMAIAGEPQLLIADEPTTALDVTIQRQILELIKRLTRERDMAVLFITHDLALVGEFADEVVVMRHGELREQGSVEKLFLTPQDAYTRALLQCRPSFDHRPWRLPVVNDVLHDNLLQNSIKERVRGIQEDDSIVMRVRHLSKRFEIKEGLFSRRYFDAVKNVSCDIRQGKTLGVVGESGSGKTTLGLMLAGILNPSEGSMEFDQSLRALTNTAERIQIVFQNPFASLNPRFTVFQILSEPFLLHRSHLTLKEREAEVIDLMALVGLEAHMMYRYPHEFSGGQRQRIAIARCLALKPKILVCDESVSALDVSIQAQVLNLLQDLQDQLNLSLVFISHDLSVVRYMSDEIMVMHQGRVVEHGETDQLLTNPKERYTQNLLSAIPRGFVS